MNGKELKKARLKAGFSQQEVANALAISRSMIAKIETGKRKASNELAERLLAYYDQVVTNLQLEAKFDFMRVRFPTNDLEKIVSEVLKLDFDLFVYTHTGFAGYAERYSYGDINVFNSHAGSTRGVMIELRGQGCREYEVFIDSWSETWKDFIFRCLTSFDSGVNFARVDLALDDYEPFISIPTLKQKIQKGYYKTQFKTVREHEDRSTNENQSQGKTIYWGSPNSLMYFCFYQKDLEQQHTKGLQASDVPIKNRYELRLKDRRANKFIQQYLKEPDFARLLRSVIAKYITIYDWDSRAGELVVNRQWKKLMTNIVAVDLKLDPQPFSFVRKMNWFANQVGQTHKLLFEYCQQTGNEFLLDLLTETELNDVNQQLLEQALYSYEEIHFFEEKGFVNPATGELLYH